jgi:hypothetical protein
MLLQGYSEETLNVDIKKEHLNMLFYGKTSIKVIER